MTTPLFKPRESINILAIVTYVLAVLGVISLVYFGGMLIKNKGNLKGKSALTVNTLGVSAEVYLNGTRLGTTPFESKDIGAGENKLSIKTETSQYNVALDFLPNSEVALSRDLGVSDLFSSGQNFWLEKTNSSGALVIVSEPTGARVLIDNTEVGVTPYSSETLTEGEYDLRIEKAGYESQTARIKVQNNYKLNIALKLFPIPVPSKVALLDGSTTLYDLYSAESIVTSDSSSWVKAVIYWNKTRGVNLAGTGLNKELVFDYFVDYSGSVYNKEGLDVTGDLSSMKDLSKGAYLRRVSDGAGLTDAAKTALQALSVSGGKKATIGTTGTGWLNVRSLASLNGSVLAQVNTGESFPIIEESTGWVKIKVSDTVSGWVSSTYVTVSQ